MTETREPRRAGWPPGAVAALAFVVGVIVLLLLLRPDGRRVPLVERLPEQTVLDFEAEVTGRLSDVVVRPAHRLRLRGSGVVWLDDTGASWLESPRVSAWVRIGPALAGPIVVEDGVVEQPRLRLVRYGPGRWNYEAPLAAILDPARATGDEPTREFRARNILARNGIATLIAGDQTHRATDVDLTLAAGVFTGPGLAEPWFHFSRGEATLALPDTAAGEVTRRVTATDARLRLPNGTVAFEVDRVGFGSSVATDLRGVWDPALGGFGVDAAAFVERLELADIPWLRVETPEDAVGSGRVRIQPLPGDRTALAVTDLAVRSETSAATGSVRMIVGPGAQFALDAVDLVLDPLALSLVEAFTGPLPYVGALRGTVRGTAADLRFQLRADLAVAPTAETFAIDLDGQIAFTDAGVDLRRVVAELRAVPLAALEPLVPGIPLQGPVSGTVTLEGMPREVPVRLDVRLETAGGIVALAGTLDLRGAVPAYDLTGRLVQVDLQRLLEPAAPPARLTAAFGLTGRGVEPATATASLRVDGGFTGWQAAPGDTVALRVQALEGLLRAEQVRVRLGPVDLTATGNWRFADGVGGAIQYALAVTALEPLAPFLPPGPAGLPRFTRGAIAAEGTLGGTLDAPALAGSVRAVDFWFGEWAASRLDGTYDVRLGPGLPHAIANITARDVRTPGGDFTTAALALQFDRPTFELHARGERAAGRGLVEVEAGGRIDDVGPRFVEVRTIELDLDRRRWRLPEPALVEWLADDVVQVTNFALRPEDGDGLVRLDGVVWPLDATDLAIEAAQLPLGDLVGLVRADLAIAGDLWLQGTVRGPADAPTVLLDAELRDAAVQDVAIEAMGLTVRYAGQTLSVIGEGRLNEFAPVELDATLPLALTLDLPPTAELIADLPIRARLTTEQFDLAVLEPAVPMVTGLQGWLTANLSLDGTPADPVLSGGAALTDGAVTVRVLNQRYTGIEGEANLEGDLLVLERLVAHSDGTAALAGSVRFEELADPVMDLTAQLQGFRAQGVAGRRSAAITGELRIQGTPDSPVLSGNLVAQDGTLDLARIQPPGTLSEDLIGVAERFDPLAPVDFDLLEPEETGLRISRLDLTAGGDLWFQSHELRAQLEGTLVVEKPAEDVMISGTLTGLGGTFNLRIGPATRRFDIVEANIQFFGTPGPDPAVDITASRLILGPNRTDFELRVRVTGTLSSPTIAFATEDGTSIPEAEALNFLIFGRATATLADFPGAGLGTTQGVYDALAFYGAFDWLSAALAEQFGAGIDYFQLQVRAGAGEFGPELAFMLGHEIARDLFVLVTLPTTEFEARWAVTGEWRIDRQWTLQGGYEPPDLVLGVPGRRLPFALEREQQLFMSIRRRWTY